MSIPHGSAAAGRGFCVASALLLAACSGVGEGPTGLIAPRPAAITPSPSATATATPTAPVALVIGVEACTTASILATWTVTRLAEQTVVVPVDENNVMSVRSEVAAGAGGVILFGSSAPTNLGAQLQALDAVAPDGIKPFIMTDEEGGVVQRMANLVGSIPSARQMGATMTPAQIQQLAFGLAQRMHAAGVTMDLAPVLDVDGGQGPNNLNADGTRSFSANVATASSDGIAFATGLRNGGIVPVVKHFPGLGGATGNTDVTAAATQSWGALQGGGLRPFEAAIAAHVPALGAGADMVLYNADPSTVATVTSQTVSAIVAAVNTDTLTRAALETAAGRVLAAKGVNLCP